MSQDEEHLMRSLADLKPIEPESRWEGRVLARCHSAISKRALRGRLAASRRPLSVLVDWTSAAILCLYLSAMLVEAARLAGHS